ncbi:MAG: RES family NAD+ phosphorylase [Gemmatimonadaceae bacterium]
MSSNIWTQCAGASRRLPLHLSPWRVVEAQHLVSTRKLVDSDDEQVLLEELIDSVKPADITRGRIHYLLFTPFRYPPLPHGSRFGTVHERGVWYGALEVRTAFAEVAYYRLLFLAGTDASIGTISTALTLFSAGVRTKHGIDLTQPPFEAYRGTISSKTKYEASQALGAAMRADQVEAAIFSSARDAEGGRCIAVFAAVVFGRSRPRSFATWHCAASTERVDFSQSDYFVRQRFSFDREQFLVKGALPSPAVGGQIASLQYVEQQGNDRDSHGGR